MNSARFISSLTAPMYIRLRKCAGRINHYWSEDIVQEAAISAWSNRSAFKGDCDFEGWMSRIVINTGHTFNRNLGVCRVYDCASSVEDRPHSDTPHTILEADRKLGAIITVLNEMKPTKRNAWMIYHTTPALFKDMPALIGGTVGSNKSRVSRADSEVMAVL